MRILQIISSPFFNSGSRRSLLAKSFIPLKIDVPFTNAAINEARIRLKNILKKNIKSIYSMKYASFYEKSLSAIFEELSKHTPQSLHGEPYFFSFTCSYFCQTI